MTGERVTILELPHQNPEHRVAAELLALVGARVVGEHRHPALVERFTVLEGCPKRLKPSSRRILDDLSFQGWAGDWIMEIGQIARVLLTTSGLILGTGVAEAQQAKIPLVGLLVLGGPAPTIDAFRRGLDELGYVEGRNIVIEPRFAEGQLDRVSAFAAELIRLDADVI